MQVLPEEPVTRLVVVPRVRRVRLPRHVLRLGERPVAVLHLRPVIIIFERQILELALETQLLVDEVVVVQARQVAARAVRSSPRRREWTREKLARFREVKFG